MAVGTAVLAARLAVVDPARPGHYPGCPFYTLTGLYCPGCGGLRALHDLTQGEIVAALSSNLLVTLAVPVCLGLWIRWVLRVEARSGNTAAASARAVDSGWRAAATEVVPATWGDSPDVPGSGAKGSLRDGSRVWGPTALALGLILFAVLRNLPGLELLAP